MKIKKLFTVTIKCPWCGHEVPIIGTRPVHCPWCKMSL